MIGLAAVVSACFLSGFAGVYFEKVPASASASCAFVSIFVSDRG